MNEETGRIYSFDSFQVDPVRRRLSRDGEAVPIHSKTFDLLLALIENRGRVIEKDELMGLVWANQIVEEGNLTVKMSALRKTLGERKDEARFIVTVPGRGYRFVADVRQTDAQDDALVIERHAVTHITVEEEIEADVEHPASLASEAHTNGHVSGHTAAPSTTAVQSLPHTSSVSVASEVKSKVRLRYVVITASLVVVSAAFGYLFNQTRNSKTAIVPPAFQQAVFKRLTTSGKIAAAAISPDGNYFVFAQKEDAGQSLWVRQVAESRSIQIMATEAHEYWGLTFTPDGSHIYATVFTPKKADPELLRVPTLGGAVERLPNVSCSAVTFSPDGKRFAYVVSSTGSGGTLLRVANADGGDDKFLAIIKDPGYFVFPDKTLSWSPDGESIACAVKIVDGTGDYGTVMNVRVADGSLSPLTKRHFPLIESVSWLWDGSGLLMTANETAIAPMQLWHLSRESGEARRLSNDLSSYSWVSVTADGEKLFAVGRTVASSLWVAPFDPEAGDDEGMTGAPERIADELIDYGEIAWTPAGKIVYRSGASGTLNLWTMDADGTNQTQLTKDAMPDKGLAVSPDNRFVVFSSYRAGNYNL